MRGHLLWTDLGNCWTTSIAVGYWSLFILYTYMTGFGKMCIVHTFNFAHLEMHKSHREWYTNLKLSGMIKEYNSNSISTVSHPSVILNRFYKSPKLKNWMCELCTFSQILMKEFCAFIYLFIYDSYCLSSLPAIETSLYTRPV